jgi:hypothetical protein
MLKQYDEYISLPCALTFCHSRQLMRLQMALSWILMPPIFAVPHEQCHLATPPCMLLQICLNTFEIIST